MRTIFEHPPPHQGVAHTVRFTLELREHAVVDDSVDDRGCHPVVAENRSPAEELHARGGHDRLPLASVGEGLGHRARPVGVERQEAEFVDYEQRCAAYLRRLEVEPSLVAGATKSHRRRRHSGETCLRAPVAGQPAQGARHAGLARAAGDMPAMSAYLATALRLSLSFLAISARGTPAASISRISLISSRGTVISSILPRRVRPKQPPGKTIRRGPHPPRGGGGPHDHTAQF